ncbi:MAG TPA: ATP-binding cassette domain-containing protein [Actinophytocola sp.]|jgi:D-methionine transport system ATP-binding protein|uniref:methionine ABC transporter ATP-binding protein n=1 Tax=Actinophytocola sp. TaxID=1872138 RepID=UPI002F9361DC
MITAKNLKKLFDGRAALDGVSLDLPAGGVTGVVGAAGAGKSTLARVLALRDRPDSGSVWLDGLNTTALPQDRLRQARRDIGLVPAQDELLPGRTVAGNVAAPLERSGADTTMRRRRVGMLLDLIGLTGLASADPGTLSPGQRRRLTIAQTLVMEPAVLVADEPTRGLDAESANGVLAALDRARGELGATVVLATGDPSVAGRISDHVAILAQGRVVDCGSLLDVATDPDSLVADALLPSLRPLSPRDTAAHDRVVDVVLVGFAAVGALLPEAAHRFGVHIEVIGGGLTRFSDTPVARFRLGVCGTRVDSALVWIADCGALVRHTSRGPSGIAA